MILVDIYVPSVNQEFDFGLDETVRISSIIEEVASMISQKLQCDLNGKSSEFFLCSLLKQNILPRDYSLEECGISNGDRLILV